MYVRMSEYAQSIYALDMYMHRGFAIAEAVTCE